MEAVREKSVEDLASYLRESGVPDIYCECFEGKVSLCIVVMFIFVTGFGKTGLIAGLVKIDFFLEKASTKFKYCLRKI